MTTLIRPKVKPATELISIKLETELKLQFQFLCAKAGVTMSEAIRNYIEAEVKEATLLKEINDEQS